MKKSDAIAKANELGIDTEGLTTKQIMDAISAHELENTVNSLDSADVLMAADTEEDPPDDEVNDQEVRTNIIFTFNRGSCEWEAQRNGVVIQTANDKTQLRR